MASLCKGFCLLALAPLAWAAAVPSSDLGLVARDTVCTNGPFTRACWKDGYSIATDFDQKFPTTGNTVSYNLDITNGTCNKGGSGEKVCFFVNGQNPGPTIRATWGDTLSITVNNKMQHNETSIHWHGVRQFNTPGEDGVNGISGCAVAPGDSKTYTFHVTQFGSSWYHSHTSAQYGDGVVGGIIFDGPASSNYDTDLGSYLLSEVYQGLTAWQVNAIAQQNLQQRQGPPSASNILINGEAKSSSGEGSYNQMTITKGKKYRLRLVNIAVDSYIRVSLDSHILTVMTSDFVPINPFTTKWILLGIGQRYDVVIHADQPSGNYWFRTESQTGCFSSNAATGLAIWSYADAVAGTPGSSAWQEPSGCIEPPMSPYWKQPVPSASFQNTLDTKITNAVVTPDGNSMVVWALNKPIWVDYANPTMQYLMEGNTSYPDTYNVINTNGEGSWNYWLITSDPDTFGLDHPIHLHGHDFFVIGQDTGTYDESTVSLNWENPVRRDTATLPASGWLAIAFSSNNPGAWLMHCHIAWHIGEGLGMQYVEAPDQVVFPNKEEFAQTCNNYKAYAASKPEDPHGVLDSGL
ncbi:hypothetical protein Q7P35_008747 [Cladosporium inversicolor]